MGGHILFEKILDNEFVHMHVDDKRHIFYRRDYESLHYGPTQASVDYYQLFLKMCYPEYKSFEFSLELDEEDFVITIRRTGSKSSSEYMFEKKKYEPTRLTYLQFLGYWYEKKSALEGEASVGLKRFSINDFDEYRLKIQATKEHITSRILALHFFLTGTQRKRIFPFLARTNEIRNEALKAKDYGIKVPDSILKKKATLSDSGSEDTSSDTEKPNKNKNDE